MYATVQQYGGKVNYIMEDIINIGKRRELFWDDTMLDTKRTRTTFKMHELTKRECVIRMDDPWGGDGCNYISVIQDDGIYRMYVNVHRTPGFPGIEKWKGSVECYFESTDGIHWEKPSLGIFEFEGSKENNVMFPYYSDDPYSGVGDGFRVMKDTRPDCPAEERYKAVADQEAKLQYFSSPDGKYFTRRHELDLQGQFDSVNTLLYDDHMNKFRCFYRTYHPSAQPMEERWYRDIRVADSEDLVNWSDSHILNYDSYVDWQLYTNAISRYYRADHVYVGFPARYVEREIKWTSNYDELCGKEKRRVRFDTMDKRCGIAVTDCLFMTSRDGLNWKRYNEAFLRPGPESGRNWVYGDMYLSAGMVETKSPYEGCDNEISMYCGENRWMGIPGEIYRYTMRLDGFVSQNAPWDMSWDSPALVTKKFIYEGKDLFINFSTSAYGHMVITLRADDGRSISTGEIFGDSTNRHVVFENGSPADLEGQPVVMEIKMRDADMYSFKFE